MAALDLNAPTDERRSRGAFLTAPAIGTESEPARAGMRMYRALTTLERLARDGTISTRQAEAGELLRTDHELGICGARDTAGGGGAVGWHYAEARLAAVQRYRLALSRLGPLWRYVLPVAVGLTGSGEISISELARCMRQNRQEVAGIVKFGLDVLADHYQLA